MQESGQPLVRPLPDTHHQGLSLEDLCTLNVLLEHLVSDHLPRALRLLEHVEDGGRLREYDILWLKDVCIASRALPGLAQRHPRYGAVFSRYMLLYREIIVIGVENEPA